LAHQARVDTAGADATEAYAASANVQGHTA